MTTLEPLRYAPRIVRGPGASFVCLVACARPVAAPSAERDLDVRVPVADAGVVDGAVVDLLAAPSVRFTANAPVRAEASAASARIGIVGRDARAKAVEAKPPIDGCSVRWIRIEPRGWVCEANLVASSEPPTTAVRVGLDDETQPELVGYGSVRVGSAWIYADAADAEANGGYPPFGAMQVRAVGEKRIRGIRYAELGDGSLIEPHAIAPSSPSPFRGVTVLAGKLDMAWTRRAIGVFAKPGGRAIRTLPVRSQVTIRETSADRRFVRIAESEWVARGELRVPVVAEQLPPTVADDERWFDVDLDQQVLVAYEGLRPVYATLVSTGRPAHPTRPALARVVVKHRATTMTDTAADDSYSVADVPWAMFYEHTLALHGTYWHDGFGAVRSHGCVNLAPRDARILYDWSAPEVPPGWNAVFSTPTIGPRGSLVQIQARGSR